jgi:hypothetical protein
VALGTPVIGAASTFTAGGTSLTVPYATITGAGALVLLVGTHPETVTVTTPAGWTAPSGASASGGAGTFGLNTGPTQAVAFVKDAAGETGSLTVTVSAATSSGVWGRIIFIPSGGGTLDYTATGGVDSTTGTAWSVTFGANPGMTAGDRLITGLVFPTATLPTFASSAITAAGGTFTEAFLNNPTAGGNGAGGRVESWTLTGTATAAPVHTITLSGTTTNDAGAEVLIRVRELPPTSLPELVMATPRY